MIKRPQKYLLNKAADIAHRTIVAGCIGLSLFGMYGIGAWFYTLHTLSDEEKQAKILNAVGRLKQQDGVEIIDKAKDLST